MRSLSSFASLMARALSDCRHTTGTVIFLPPNLKFTFPRSASKTLSLHLVEHSPQLKHLERSIAGTPFFLEIDGLGRQACSASHFSASQLSGCTRTVTLTSFHTSP